MSKQLFCAECGLPITVYRKAMPKFGTIIDLVIPHECLKEPVEPDLTYNPVPTFQPTEKKGKFVQKLDDLNLSFPGGSQGMVGTDDLRDRREEVKSTAPLSIADQIKGMMEPKDD